jgi:hypothetical protein
MRFYPSNIRERSSHWNSSYSKYSGSSYYTSSSRSLSAKAMFWSDYLKVLVISFFTVFCIYTYFDKYFEIYLVTPNGSGGQPRSLPAKLTIKPDTVNGICSSKGFHDDLLAQCQQDFITGCKKASSSCDSYYQKLRGCSSNCQVEMNNVDSCVNAVLRPIQKKWDVKVPS